LTGDHRYRSLKGLSCDDDTIGENDGELRWEHIRWLVGNTSLPVICKGILSPADAVLAVEHGASGIIVSNHGGRQTDTTPHSIEMLPLIVKALQDHRRQQGIDHRGDAEAAAAAMAKQTHIFLDSGVRKGSHVLKALALGATAVLVGRPVLWGLAAGGQQGVEQMLSVLRQELVDDMACTGCKDIADIGGHILFPAR
jgi:isopentenyl diphosphate isomerase/L-lactate dehydrogenase-like FMN-dependent dehydrogenase